MIDTRKMSDEEIMQDYHRYEKGLMQAMAGDKRTYNTKMDITFNKAMLSMYEKELNDRNMKHNNHFNWK